MDDYPMHLAPEFEEWGGVSTPFDEWWPRVREAFASVPEEVGREWLHRHWSHSPYSWLRSADYRFTLETWNSTRLLKPEIRWRHDHFAASLDNRLEHAAFVMRHPRGARSWLANYMLEHRHSPTPPVLLDNRDDHLGRDYPAAYLLIEGHNRLEFATYLRAKGNFSDSIEFWIMQHVQNAHS